jgi:ATP-dependent RNA helicase SUPV3L1/SUV3
VLVASDAVGMGLNLEITRVVFSTVEKFDGVQDRPLHVSEILQVVKICSKDL